MAKWNEHNGRDVPPPRKSELKEPNSLGRTISGLRAAGEILFASTSPQVSLPPETPYISAPAPDRGDPLKAIHDINEADVEERKKRNEAEQLRKNFDKENVRQMNKGEIRETPPTKPPEKPAEKATSEISKAQAEKQRVLAPDAKVVRSTVEPPRPVHRAPGIKEVDFSPKPQETKKEGTGKDGKEEPTKHKFETPDQPKPKPTIQGPKM